VLTESGAARRSQGGSYDVHPVDTKQAARVSAVGRPKSGRSLGALHTSGSVWTRKSGFVQSGLLGSSLGFANGRRKKQREAQRQECPYTVRDTEICMSVCFNTYGGW
jgi:hypothetical protein